MPLSNPGKVAGDPNIDAADIRYRTNYATKPDVGEGEISDSGDPMEGMIEMEGGGYNLEKFIAMDPDNNPEISSIVAK